jgi:hypothetical protein
VATDTFIHAAVDMRLLFVARVLLLLQLVRAPPAVHFEPPVALHGGAGQPQAHSTNTMGLFHLGGDNAVFQEFTVDYYPYQNRTALLFSSDAGRRRGTRPVERH